MAVEIIVHPTDEDWRLCKLAALNTVGKTAVRTMPDDEWKHKMLRARHSPIRTLMFMIRVNPVESWVATHFARHVHLTPFIQTQRNDRQDAYDRRKAPQDAPVSMMLWLNAEELMTVANKRLCGCASPETRAVARDICAAVIEVNPEFSPFLVPFCLEYGCHEFDPCGDATSYLPRNGRRHE